MQSNRKSVLHMAQAGVVAALYVVLTLLANALGIGSMAVQFRFSEVLTILPVLTPAAVPGLAAGCFLANLISSPLGPVDWIFGTAGTLLGAVLCRLLRNVQWRGLPIPAALMPVVSNAFLVALEIACLSASNRFAFANFSGATFLYTLGTVALGEAVMCVVGGLVLYRALVHSRAGKACGFAQAKEQ